MLSIPRVHGRPRMAAASRVLGGVACALALCLGSGGPANGAATPDPAGEGGRVLREGDPADPGRALPRLPLDEQGKKRRGGLALDSKAGWEQGGPAGPRSSPATWRKAR